MTAERMGPYKRRHEKEIVKKITLLKSQRAKFALDDVGGKRLLPLKPPQNTPSAGLQYRCSLICI